MRFVSNLDLTVQIGGPTQNFDPRGAAFPYVTNITYAGH
jgi:hypothetical protein